MRARVVRWSGAIAVAAAVLLVTLAPEASRIGMAPADIDLPMAEPESVGMSSERLARVDTYFQRFIDAGQLAGVVTLVARRGQVVHYGAQGWRAKEDEAPMRRDTIFDMASMTKPIVATALMMLFEEGHFRLDDPIADWLPEYENHQVRVENARESKTDGLQARWVTIPEARPVTIRHVLTHTSGLTLNPEGMGLTEAQIAEVTNVSNRFETLAERVRRAAVIPGHFHPGDDWEYGASNDWVAVLVETISGQSLDDFLRARIFGPLGMVDTYYYVPREKVARLAAVYQLTDEGTMELFRSPAYVEPTGYFSGSGGLKSTVADYYRFAQMIANGGELDGVRLLGRMTVDTMISNHIGADKLMYVRGPGYGFGLGFSVLTDPARAEDALSLGSYGWLGVLGTMYWADPVEDLIGIMCMQWLGHRPFDVRPRFTNVVSQAVIDSLADQRPKVMGHATPH